MELQLNMSPYEWWALKTVLERKLSDSGFWVANKRGWENTTKTLQIMASSPKTWDDVLDADEITYLQALRTLKERIDVAWDAARPSAAPK